MKSPRAAVQFVREHWFLTIAVLVNLAIATPAEAIRYDDDTCIDVEEEEWVQCCTVCWFFCDCEYDHEGGAN